MFNAFKMAFGTTLGITAAAVVIAKITKIVTEALEEE